MNNMSEITRERLERWTKKLDAENATPVVLLAVSHGRKGGQMVLCTVEDLSDENLILFLTEAVRLLRSKK